MQGRIYHNIQCNNNNCSSLFGYGNTNFVWNRRVYTYTPKVVHIMCSVNGIGVMGEWRTSVCRMCHWLCDEDAGETEGCDGSRSTISFLCPDSDSHSCSVTYRMTISLIYWTCCKHAMTTPQTCRLQSRLNTSNFSLTVVLSWVFCSSFSPNLSTLMCQWCTRLV